MQTTRLSSKGQVIIPKAIRLACHLNVGQELDVEITAEGILLRTKPVLPRTSVNDLIGCTGYQGKAKSLEEMTEGIRRGVLNDWGQHDSN